MLSLADALARSVTDKRNKTYIRYGAVVCAPFSFPSNQKSMMNTECISFPSEYCSLGTKTQIVVVKLKAVTFADCPSLMQYFTSVDLMHFL